MKEWVIVIGVIVLVGVVLLAGYYWISKSNGNDGGGDISSKGGCEAAGGLWGVYEYMVPNPQESCNLPTKDAGKDCTDSSECESFCEAPENSEEGDLVIGHCYGWQKHPSCSRMVIDGNALPEACV